MGWRIPFVFDTLGLGTETLLGRDPPPSLADVTRDAWVAFAAGGHCGWSKYDLAGRPTMRFDTRSEIADDPLAVELALWKGVRGGSIHRWRRRHRRHARRNFSGAGQPLRSPAPRPAREYLGRGHRLATNRLMRDEARRMAADLASCRSC